MDGHPRGIRDQVYGKTIEVYLFRSDVNELLIPEVLQQRALKFQINEDFVDTVPFSEQQDILSQIHEVRILGNTFYL